MALITCEHCGTPLIRFGAAHPCKKSSGGGVEGHKPRVEAQVAEAVAKGVLQPLKLHREGGSPAGEVEERSPRVVTGAKSGSGVEPGPPEPSKKFDRNAYQREYMRKWRAAKRDPRP